MELEGGLRGPCPADDSATSQAMGTSSQFGMGDIQPTFDDFNGLSSLQDIDLFNTLDWVLDDNVIAWPGGQSFPPLP